MALLAVTAAPAHARKLIPVDSDPAPGKGLVVTVTDELHPLRAHVWVESMDGKLLAEGNTEEDGRLVVDIAEQALAAGVAITAHAGNHGAVSFLDNVAHRVSLELPIATVDAYGTLRGRLNGIPENDDEEKASLGLVAKALQISDLVQLDSSSFISPLTDTIDVLGPRKIPSNLVLPDQTFPIYFIPIRVNKPIYRLPMLAGTSSKFFGVSGTVKVQQAIEAIRSENTWDLVNLLSFDKVTLTGDVTAPRRGETKALDLTLNTPIKDNLRIKTGRNTTPGEESKRLAISLWEPIAGTFVPTDVKQVTTERELTLTAVERKTAKVMDVLVNKNGTHFRGAWLKNTNAAMPDAGLNSTFTVNALDSAWTITGGESASLVIAHVEAYKTTSVNSHRYEDRWVVVGPRKQQMRLPAMAYAALRGVLGTIDHVSIDLLQLSSGGYPFINGIQASGDLSVLEKIRKEVQ